jgi:hypothetical protein
MDRPELMTERTLSDLRQMIADYPYFHAARLLYLKNMAVMENILFPADLKKMAIHIPDRMKLFMLLESDRSAAKPSEQPKAPDTKEKDQKFRLIEQFLMMATEGGSGGGEPSSAAETALTFDSPTSSDYMNNLLTSDPHPVREVKLQRHELIDSFIENANDRTEKRITLLPPHETGPGEANEIPDTPPNEAADKESLNDTYFTETLARVYIKQKRYDKALEIIRNLSLKYPGKNTYFADQIRFLEKLIIHIKPIN